MAAAVVAYTLPTIQLVCHLVALGTSGTNVTNSVPVTTQLPTLGPIRPQLPTRGPIRPQLPTQYPPIDQLPPQSQPVPLPDGYVPYPDVRFAYKYHPEERTWIPAREICLEEGAQLAVIDTPQKIKYLARLQPKNWLLSGVIRVDGTWINANTGEPIQAIDIWKPNQPNGTANCAQFGTWEDQGLQNFQCIDKEDFFCEIPIITNSAKTVN